MLRGKEMGLPEDDDLPQPENTLDGRLTSIHTPYTLAATPDACEVNDLMVRHFIETLAEVALAVASRKIASEERGR